MPKSASSIRRSALCRISFGLTGTLQGSIGVENLEPVSSSVYGGISSAIGLSTRGLGEILSVSPSVGASANLAAFDGKINFAGPSGKTFSGLSNSQSAQKTYTVGAPGPQLPTAPFIGTGKVALPVTATANANVSGPLNLAARTQAAAGATVTVKYGTDSASSGGGGTYAGSSFSLSSNVSWALAMLGAEQTPIQTRTLSEQNGDWTRNVRFSPFDPALGTLLSANLTLSGTVKASLSIEDTGRTAGFYDVDQSVGFSLLGPNGEALDSATAASNQAGSLKPVAGTDSFSEPFGTTIDDTILSSLGFSSDAAATDLAFFSDADPVSLAVEAFGTLSAELPGSADLLSSALEGAQITLSYTYLPGVDPPLSANLVTDPVPEPGSLAILAFSVAAFGVFRRRPEWHLGKAIRRDIKHVLFGLIGEI